MRLDGEVNQTVRAASVTRFQQDSKCKAALLSVTSCAEGITLTAASVVIFCELYWVPGLMEQAEARAHRVGQKDCVMCMYLVMPDSPDEVIFKMLEKKKKDTSLILDGCESGLLASSSQQSEDTSNKLVEELSVEQMANLLDSDWEPVKRRKI
jgi:SNF2 family DNA or RNA helicase